MANSTPARKKRKASEATTAAAAASRDADASQQTPMSKAEKRAEAMRRAQEYRDRLKAKKQAGSGSGDAGDAAGSSGSSSSSRPSPKKKKAAAGGKAGKKSSTSAKGKAGAKGKGKAKRSPARKSTAAASAASAATPTRATRSAGVVETPDTVPRPMPTSTGKGKSQGKRGGGRSAATGTRAAEDASSSDEDEEEDEMDVEEDVDEDKKDEDGEEASFSSDDERTARARNHGTPRKRRKVGRSPPKTKTEANGVRGDGDDGGSDAAAKRKGEAAAERKARKAEEERRAREWRERKYHSPPSSTGAGAANGGGAADATTCRAPVARTTVEARSPPRQRSAAPPRVAASAATARTSPVAPRPTTSRPRPRPVVQNGHGRTSAPRAPAATPDSIQARRREQQPLEHLPHEEDEVEDGEERSVLSKYPYLVILLVVCAPLGIGMFLGSSGLARPALKDFTDELGGMLAETKRNLLPGQQANSQLIRCLADSPDVPAVEHTGADEEGDDATGRTTFSANTGSGDDSPWWTKTPPALISKTATAATSKTCAGSANPLPCPRHGRCAHGFLVDCRADDAIAGRSNLFAVSEESFSDCVLSTEAKQIVSAIQGKVIDLSIEQKCNVSCRWGVGVPFISSTMTPKERCGGVDPDDVMAVRSKDDTVDYFFSVDGLVGAMDYDVTSDADSPSAGVPAISSEIVQLLAPHLDEGIIKYIPGSSAILTPRIGLTIDFVSNKLDEYLPFSCWFPAKVWECVLFLLGLVVVVFSWIFRFIRTNPGHAFYIFLTIVAAQHIYLWVERRLIIREAKIVVELVRNELAAHPEGAAVRQLHIRDDIGQTHHLYAGTSVRAGLRRKWMYRKVWKRVKNEIERDRRFRSEKRRTERGSYMEFWVVEFKSRRGE